MNPVATAVAYLDDIAKQTDTLLVAYSGGKDSLVVADLAHKSKKFKKVMGVYLFFVPGLQVIESSIRYAKRRWGMEVVQLPHFALLNSLREGLNCNNLAEYDDLPKLKEIDCYYMAKELTGINYIVTGMKNSDYMKRSIIMRAMKKHNIHSPIETWIKSDVMKYLDSQKIPKPSTFKGAVTGICMKEACVLWLHDNHHEDYQKFIQWFPYAEAYIKRREYRQNSNKSIN